MEQSDVKRFIDQVRSDASLQSRLGSATDAEGLVAGVVRLAGESGYSFTAEQVRSELTAGAPRAGATGSELSDSELEAVAGGGFVAMIKCALTIAGGTCNQRGGGIGCLSGTARS